MTQRSEVEQKDNQGFSWVSLFFQISVITFLEAIALSEAFHTMDHNAQQAEAKNNIRSMSRAQQVYHLENSSFTNSLKDLGLGISPENENYSYQIMLGIKTGENRYRFVSPDNINGQKDPFPKLNKTVFPPPLLKFDQLVMITAQPKKPELKTYIKLIMPCIDASTGGSDCNHDTVTFAAFYESEKPSIPPPKTLTISLPIPLPYCSEPGCLYKAFPTPKGFKLLSK